MRAQVTLEPSVATELAGSEDAVLKALEGHLACDVFLRGNVLTLDGEPDDVAVGREVIDEISDLIAKGHQISPGTIGAVTSALDQHESPSAILGDVVWTHRSTRVAPKTVNQKRYVDSIRHNTITFGIGPAGTGKTYLAMAMAVSALMKREVSRIILARPAVEAGEKLGFLPGDMIAKVNPYLRPLYDALFDMMDMERATRAIERGDIEIAPLAFMRGRTLNDSFVILDEAQNATAEQMKMFLTRLGFNSKAVVTGDITQVDLPPDRVSGLIEVRDILRHIEGISFVYFDERDVVRHKLVQDIIKAYDQHENADQLQPRAAQAGRRASPGSHGRPSSSLPTQPKGSWGQPH
jgi:phosphate starvation-inducible PhoH-like protein